MLCYGGSFRTRRDNEVAAHGADEFALHGTYRDEVEIDHGMNLSWSGGTKRIEVDESVVADRRDLVSRLPAVVFRHDDMAFVNGAPELQRYFLDQTLSMDNPLYIDDARRYKQVLRNRNAALKQRTLEVLDVLDRQLAESGLIIQERRAAVMQLFRSVLAADFVRISGLENPLELHYRPSWRFLSTVDDVCAHLRARRERELAFGTTMSGPHRDRVDFVHNGVDWLTRASTGQIRLTALILRVAQARFVEERTKRAPILLLDDVLLELDPARRERLVDALPPTRQRFFTFLPGEPYEAYRSEETLVYLVEDGRTQRA